MTELIKQCPICQSQDTNEVIKQSDVYGNDKQEFIVAECKKCSLLFLKNRPTEQEIGKYYDFDYQPFRSDYNWASELFINWRTRQELKTFAKLNGNIKDVLDIGCANGAYLEKLKKNSAFDSYTGIDVNAPTIEGNNHKNNIKFITGDFLTTIFAPSTYDLIVMNHVIEHVYQPAKVLEKIYDLLRPGGLLLIKTPNYLTVERMFFRENWNPYEIPRHIYVFSLKSMKLLFVRANLNVVLEKYEKTPNNIILSLNNYLLRRNNKSKLANFFNINNYFLLIVFLPISIILGLFKQSGRIVLLAQKKQ